MVPPRFAIVILVFAIFIGSSIAQSSRCLQEDNCQLPSCSCPTFTHPNFSASDTKDIPQMVYFGFDDALHVNVDRFYKQLFTKDKRNPNGCPISMSLYVQDKWTNYSMVKAYYDQGMEIGSHSVTHTDIDTKQELVFEAGRQKDNLTRVAHIPDGQVIGWRSPNLKTAGDAQPVVLKDLGYTYDISLTYTRHRASDAIPWPYTLDFGYPYMCSVRPCPSSTNRHRGFWEIPVPSLYNPETGYPCAYVDSCRPSDEKAAFEYLWSNFERVYNTNRAPFGMNMHAAWFMTPDYLKATQTFIDRLLQLGDVYIVTARQVLDWMKNPVKVSEVHKLPEWGCTNASPVVTSHSAAGGATNIHNSQHSSSGQSPGNYQYYGHLPTVKPALVTAPPITTAHRPVTTLPTPRWLWPVTVTPPTITRRPVSRTTRHPTVRPYYLPGAATHQTSRITTRPPTITNRPWFIGQGVLRTTRPPTITSKPGGIHYPASYFQPRTTRPPTLTFGPGSRTTRPPTITYRPASGTTRPPTITYRPASGTTRPPTITYRPSSGTTRPPTITFRPVSRTHRQETTAETLARTTTRPPTITYHPAVGTYHPVTSTLRPAQPRPILIDVEYHPIQSAGTLVSSSRPGEEGAVVSHRTVQTSEDCEQGVTCSLPSCACRSLVPPARLSVDNTPQIIYLTFTGSITGVNYQRVLSLLTSPARHNPNHCPITATFFIPGSGNYLPYVDSLRSRGEEIALYGNDPYMFNHRRPIEEQIRAEVENFKYYSSETSQRTSDRSAHLGYRSPSGVSLGMGLLGGLHAGKAVYDSSLVTSRQGTLNDVIPWPYTLDHGWKDCGTNTTQCALGNHAGLWEVPIVPLLDSVRQSTCTYADACHSRPAPSQDVFTFFMDNLQHALYTNRAPLGINLRNEWFSDPRFYTNVRGLEMFLDAILNSRSDVYVVSIEKMVDWMRDPQGLSQVESFEPWKCL